MSLSVTDALIWVKLRPYNGYGSGSGSGSIIGSPRKSIAPMGGYRSAALWGAAQAWLESGDSIRCDARLW